VEDGRREAGIYSWGARARRSLGAWLERDARIYGRGGPARGGVSGGVGP
jgi:hypothetical protein